VDISLERLAANIDKVHRLIGPRGQAVPEELVCSLFAVCGTENIVAQRPCYCVATAIAPHQLSNVHPPLLLPLLPPVLPLLMWTGLRSVSH
jgi:hypothetical protein